MTTYYRNRSTGKVQAHPKSGLGETFNADEIGEDGKPVKPYTSKAPSVKELKDAQELLKDKSGTPSTTTGTPAGESKQEGVN